MSSTPNHDQVSELPRGARLPFHAADSHALERRVHWFGLLLFLVLLFGFTSLVRTFFDRNPSLSFDDETWTSQVLGSYLTPHQKFGGVVLGSSRVAHGVVPEVVDAVLLGAGLESNTLNMGKSGMGFIEQIALADRLLEWERKELRWVVLELNEMDPELQAVNRLSPRAIGWHSPRATFDALDVLWRSERSGLQKIEDSWPHLLEAFCHLGNTGKAGHSLVRSLRGTRARPKGKLARARGYQPYAKQSIVSFEEYEKAKTPLAPREGRSPGLTAAHRRIYAELLARFRDAGVVPIFLRMPGFQRLGATQAAIEEGLFPNLIDSYADLHFRPLLDRSNFRDDQHLNDRGARLFSKLLGQRLAEMHARGLRGEGIGAH